MAKRRQQQTERGMATYTPRTAGQRAYLEAIFSHDVTFGVGPAGSGKTFLAVAAGLQMLQEKRVDRLCFCRPAVEAEERIGYLPGGVEQKLAPYLRPLYDAVDVLAGEYRAKELLERGVIEVCALAYMRGRTLNDAFVVLDEAQNATPKQILMFLTRIGLGSKAVVAGDLSQCDLRGVSGLSDALSATRGIDGVAQCRMESSDIVRHPVVQRIVDAYSARENNPHAG